MEVVGDGLQDGSVVGKEMRGLHLLWYRLSHELWYWRLRRWLPRLVWIGDELDVTITFKEDTLLHDIQQPFGGLFSGGLYEIQQQLNRMGIEFNTGMGSHGRDWEWDWSLRGPVRVQFRGRAKNPERRIREARPQPRVVA